MRARNLLAVGTAGLWINACEFVRNELLLKHLWIEHYRALGLTFPSEPRNAAVWVVWGFLFAAAIFAISRNRGLVAAASLSWLVGFVLMWLVTWNLGVLPLGILVYAVPLSLVEAFGGALICKRLGTPTG